VVRVVPKQVALLHRYSFDTGSDGFGDSVAGADAVRWGHAATNGFGAVFLDGTRSTWVELPPYLVDALQTFTVEAWVTTLPTSPDNTGTRLFDFGDFTAAALPAGNTRAYFSPAAGSAGDQTRIAFQTQTPLPAGENGFSTAAGTSLDGTGPHHVAAIFQADPAQPVYEAVFVDGTMTISNGGAAAITRNLTNVNNAFSFIGRSLSAGDNYLTGLIDEFRLYAGALTKAQVQADFTAGPDGAPVVGAMTPILDGSIVGSNFVVTWPDTPSGFALISSTNVISWTPVLGVPPPSNGLFTFIVPISGAGFYRLQK
jgi:hypothetical protein